MHFVAACVAVVLCAVLTACAGEKEAVEPGDARSASAPSTTESTVSEPTDTEPDAEPADAALEAVAFFLADELPAGWTVGHANQRIDRLPGPDGRTLQVVDYTVVWRPEADAGDTRSDSGRNLAAPSVALNSGAAYYRAYYERLGDDAAPLLPLEEAVVQAEGQSLRLDFLLGCCPVTLSGEGISAEELRRVAESVVDVPYRRWREALGDRLLVEDLEG